MNIPSLVEPGTKYFLYETLKNCNYKKQSYYNNIFNLFMFIFVIGIIIITLYYSYKTKQKKQTGEENFNAHEEILKVVHKMQEEKRRQNNELLTDLPKFSHPFEKTMKQFM